MFSYKSFKANVKNEKGDKPHEIIKFIFIFILHLILIEIINKN